MPADYHQGLMSLPPSFDFRMRHRLMPSCRALLACRLPDEFSLMLSLLCYAIIMPYRHRYDADY